MSSTRPEDLPDSTSQESTWSNPAKLSRKVRELAHRSYRALKADPRPDPRATAASEDLAEDLRDLRAQVARLQQKIYQRGLKALIPWVDALGKQVEDRLAPRIQEEPGERADS